MRIRAKSGKAIFTAKNAKGREERLKRFFGIKAGKAKDWTAKGLFCQRITALNMRIRAKSGKAFFTAKNAKGREERRKRFLGLKRVRQKTGLRKDFFANE